MKKRLAVLLSAAAMIVSANAAVLPKDFTLFNSTITASARYTYGNFEYFTSIDEDTGENVIAISI